MIAYRTRIFLVGATCALLMPSLSNAQSDANAPAPQPPTYPSVKISGRVQVQGYDFDNEGADVGPMSNFFIRRARIQANGQLTERVSFIIQPSFENAGGREPNLRLRDAYVDVRLTPVERRTSITLRAGQEKRPFGRYELTSSNNLPSIERGAGRGLVGLASNNLFERNGFLSHDVGASVILDAAKRVTLQAGIYNGAGESRDDVNDSKSFGVRGTVALAPKLSVGASYFAHDGIVAPEDPAPPAPPARPDSSFRNDAVGVDLAWSAPGEKGLFVVADYMQGEDFTAAASHIRGTSLVGAYHVRLGGGAARWLYAVEPALRYDRADPNTDADDDESTLWTAVLGFYFSSRTQLRVAYERQSFEEGGLGAIGGIRTAMTVNF